jgi:predicted transcriptional regulator
MAETSRVQRWRDGKRQHGLEAVTVWLTQEEELRLKDLALQWHCSPSAVMQRALAQVATSNPYVTDSG